MCLDGWADVIDSDQSRHGAVSTCVLPATFTLCIPFPSFHTTRRGYNKRKLDENLECEIMQVGTAQYTRFVCMRSLGSHLHRFV